MKQTVVQFVRFCLVGLVNTGLGLSTIFALMYLAGFSPVAANVGGYTVGLVFSFFANGKWTFNRSVTLKLAVRFLLAFAISYSANLTVLMGLLSWSSVSPWLAQICAVATYTGLFFILSKVYVYSEKDPMARGAAK